MKKTALTLVLTILVTLSAVLPAFADAIIPEELLGPQAAETKADEPDPAGSAEEEKTGAQMPDPNAGKQTGRVDSNAKSLSVPVIACAAGVLLIAVAAFIRALLQNRREALKDKEME